MKTFDVDTSTLVSRLQEEFSGQVLIPVDEWYDDARMVYSARIDRRPAAIVSPEDAGQVSRVVTLTREAGVELAVRGGGHGGAGHGVSDGGIVLDMSSMRHIEIDPEGMTASAQAGLTAGAYAQSVGEHGLATGFGDVGTVGIGGITLGGGIGFLSRKYGLTVDDVLAAEIVTADGQILETHENAHPDLFWAIRGGGGNFGVATRFTYRLHPVETVVGGVLVLPATPEVISSVVAEATAAPDELSMFVNVMVAPPMPFLPSQLHGELVVMVMLCYAGPVEDGERAVDRLRALATPLVDMVRPMPYPALFEAGGPPRATAAGHTLFLDAVDTKAAELIIHNLRQSTADMSAVQLRALGGAIGRVADDATAYAHRSRRIMANVGAVYQDIAETPKHEQWVRDVAEQLRDGDQAAYVNFLGDEGPERVRDAYPGRTWDRLREIKSRYDPENFFRMNQNIPPAGE
ncbi:FAD-binding oxidoreductase [Phytoactinopolyspora alkaliphila]|uniref:FAD-binding oxidoreductase n=1 Tax=Phytoactinopolyspora alkaliphila TaxID=1783498 RepID=A0A6N9YPZ3_9ACTN|nr:FAD-binding oxidoreductase [Phytoactinopolyspora alkaliphila]NED96899.1 FAD-binding oxidoreductase [Phytoactinopolyspora alkaliphila]